MKKVTRISRYLDNHQYPEIFYRFNILVRFIYGINYLMNLRNWHVYKTLRMEEKKQSNCFSFLDAGCGMGEYAIGTARRNRNANILGIDIIPQNISLASGMAKSMKLSNIDFNNADISIMDISEEYDIILCSSTLQFIKADETALKNIYAAMKQTGSLILYVPVRYRRYLPWSGILEAKYLSDYYYKYYDDFLMHRYKSEELLRKLESAGFKVRYKKHVYGMLGTIAFEMYSLIITAMKELNIVLAVICLMFYLCICFPIQLFMMFIDYLIPKSDGNGLLIVADK